MGDTVDDALWSAIGDPMRRRLLDILLADGPATPTGLSARLPVTRQAVSKHLAVLDRAGLVRQRTAGREKQYRLDEAQFERAVAQLSSVGAAWDGRLQRIKALAETIEYTMKERKNDGHPAPGRGENADTGDVI